MEKIFLVLAIFFSFASLGFAENGNLYINEEEKNVNSYIQKAIGLAAGGDFERAYQEYKYALEIEKTQLMEKFLELFKDILNQRVEKEIGIHLFKGLQYWWYVSPYKSDKAYEAIDEAIDEFKLVTAAKPDCELAHYLLGLIYYNTSYSGLEEGVSEYVIPAFKKAIEIDPNFASAHYWLALAYIFSDISDEMIKCKLAVEHYDKAIELDPSLKDAHPVGNALIIDEARKTLKERAPIE